MKRRIYISALLLLVGCVEIRNNLVSLFTPTYEADSEALVSEEITVTLLPTVNGLTEPVDIQFPPNQFRQMYVLQKQGEIIWISLESGKRKTLARIDVETDSEQGLLGLAFHPQFNANHLAYINYVRQSESGDESVVQEISIEKDSRGTPASIKMGREIYVLKQPYSNHNAGQIVFGPDGYLYIGWGDGGWRDDPHLHGQNPSTALGAMLRIDIDRKTDQRPYAIPPDNPFVNKQEVLPEIWAIGLRNPWRYTFTPDKRLIVADVGQNLWEEIDIVEGGKNYGWNTREGQHCFPPDKPCQKKDLVDPIWEYGRDLGQSITGGYFYGSTTMTSLQGKYVFGDFVSGRIWALRLPDQAESKATDVELLGKWPMLISTFGYNGKDLFVADFGTGSIFRFNQ